MTGEHAPLISPLSVSCRIFSLTSILAQGKEGGTMVIAVPVSASKKSENGGLAYV